MAQAPEQDGRRILGRWVLTTFLGWYLGFILLVALVVPGDLLGGGAQSPVGIGMGAGVGFLQGRFLRAWLGSPLRWTAASTIGLGAPFLLRDVVTALGAEVPYSLPAYILLGGLLLAIPQRRVLQAVAGSSGGWVPAVVAGWGLPAGFLALADSGALPDVASAACSLVGMFFGGLLLGALTGPVLVRILEAPRVSAEPGTGRTRNRV